MTTFVFTIRFIDNPEVFEFFLFTRMSYFIHHTSFSFQQVIMKKPNPLFETPCGCLTTSGLPRT